MPTTTPAPGFHVVDLHSPQEGDDVALGEGVTARILRWGRNKAGDRVPYEAIVQFAPRAAYPSPDVHEHSQEIVIVLSGVLRDDAGEYPAGTRIQAERGTQHNPRSDDTGCTLWVLYQDLITEAS